MRRSLVFALFFPVFAASAQEPGMLDTTFSGDGLLVLPEFRQVADIAISDDGAIYALAKDLSNRVVVVAVNEDGSSNTTFGVADVWAAPATPVRVFVDPQQRIIATASKGLRRYFLTGAVDSTFGTNGVVSADSLGVSSIRDADISSSGHLLVIGITSNSGSRLAMLGPDGAVDTTFGAGGYVDRVGVPCSWRYNGRRCSFQADGSILEGYDQVSWLCTPNSPRTRIGVVKRDPLGAFLDTIYYQEMVLGLNIDLAQLLGSMEGRTLVVYNRLGSGAHVVVVGLDGTATVDPDWNPDWTCPATLSYDPYGGRMDQDASGAVFWPWSWSGVWRVNRTLPGSIEIDTLWCANGGTTTSFPSFLHAETYVAKVQVDGKLIAGGSAYNNSSNRSFSLARYHNIPDPRSKLDLRMYLGGAYITANGLMRDNLRQQGLLPNLQPYAMPFFPPANGVGAWAMPQHLLAVEGEEAVVDWVFLELISAADSSTVAATRVGILHRNGWVTSADGHSPIDFSAGAGNYFLHVRHRNHLGVTISQPITLGPSTTTLDLTDPATPTFGTDAQMEVNGVRMLWPGDATTDGAVKYLGPYNDRDKILVAIGGSVPTATVTGYRTEDVNLDGVVKYTGLRNDRDVILQTIGGTVPTAVRVEQRP